MSRADARDMVRRAVQSALAGLAAYLLMRGLNLQEAFLAILSAVLIIQPSVGGTMGAAFARLQATVAGSLVSLGCLYILPDVWGTPVALALSLLVVGSVAGFRPDWSYGNVAAVAIALVPEGEAFETAGARAMAIGLGAVTGVLVSLLVWPDRAEARFDRHFRNALRATATRLDDVLQAATESSREADPPDHVAQYHKAMQEAQEALDAVKLADCAGMRRRLEGLRRLYNSIIILDRAAEADAPARSGDGSLQDQVRILRRQSCRLLKEMADGRKEPEPRTKDIDAALERLRTALAQDDPRSDRHLDRNALAFGLHEVRKTLVELMDLCKT